MSDTGLGGWRTICFDLDGCLVDSRVAIATSINAALEDLGLQPEPEERLYHFIGPPLRQAFEELLDQAGADPSLAALLIERYRRHYRVASRELTLVFAGIEPMLHTLSRRAELAVVTTKPQPYAENIVRGLGLSRYVEGGVHGPALEATDEPKTTTLRRALEAIGVAEEDRPRCAMVGDRAHDVEAAHSLGLVAVGVRWGIGSRAELEGAGVDHLVATPRELAELVP